MKYGTDKQDKFIRMLADRLGVSAHACAETALGRSVPETDIKPVDASSLIDWLIVKCREKGIEISVRKGPRRGRRKQEAPNPAPTPSPEPIPASEAEQAIKTLLADLNGKQLGLWVRLLQGKLTMEDETNEQMETDSLKAFMTRLLIVVSLRDDK